MRFQGDGNIESLQEENKFLRERVKYLEKRLREKTLQVLEIERITARVSKRTMERLIGPEDTL